MNPVLIVAGIYLSSRIISYIAGELTEEEIKEQEEIDAKIDELKKAAESFNPAEDESETAGTTAETTAEIIDESEIVSDTIKQIIGDLVEKVDARINDRESFIKEVKTSRKQIATALRERNAIHTPIRKASLELLIRQLTEAINKCYAYKQYLKEYRIYVRNCNAKEDFRPYLMTLPESYPYIGKVVWVDNSMVEDDYISLCIPECNNEKKVLVQDYTEMQMNHTDRFPIMITDAHNASIEKGLFKVNELSSTRLGTVARVKSWHKNRIILTYMNDLELCLPKDFLKDPYRFPPVRSEVLVYPVKWEFDLSYWGKGGVGYPVIVSERSNDASSSLEFQNFPVYFEKDELDCFLKYYKKKKLYDSEDEFLIGPEDEKQYKIHDGTKLKIQFGSIPLMIVDVHEISDDNSQTGFFLKYCRLCDKNDTTFCADDIFVPFDVSITPVQSGISDVLVEQYADINDISDTSSLIWNLFEEFRIQYQIKNDREGLNYFLKWEDITNQLIDYLTQGSHIVLDVDRVSDDNYYFLIVEIKEPELLRTFISDFEKSVSTKTGFSWKPHFFVKNDQGDRYIVNIQNGCRILKIIGNNISGEYRIRDNKVVLYVEDYPYAELKQKKALREFRSGQIVNPNIQAICLNSANALSDEIEENTVKKLFNSDLLSNETQLAALERSYKEKNVFFIQGPPGTGKTTVIREIVEQYLAESKNIRILIVSQANVAVDNAVSGLLENYKNDIVRCGNIDKVTDSFQDLLLSRKCEEYIEELNNKRNMYEQSLYNRWSSIIKRDEENEYCTSLYEVILRSHRIVGATCVGLSKNNIGLERTEFDLIIIDEAGKALPAELMIPLLRAKKAIVIGDHKQLPPIINPVLYDSEKIDLEERDIAENELFGHSFFERLYENAPEDCKIMLDTQYRMPSVIGSAVSQLFYDGELKNGSGTELKVPVLFSSSLTLINFDDDQYFHETKNNNQITNRVEAQKVVDLVRVIRNKDSKCRIAVITPYKGQKQLILRFFERRNNDNKDDNTWIDTIDSFQGSEAEVVIFCTTRSRKRTQFFMDKRRLNVALSRAKRELIILGRLGYFKRYDEELSVLPKLADYIVENGNIIMSKECVFLNRIT